LNLAAVSRPRVVWPRLKLFLALSRTPHGLIDMATPAFSALLWIGALPPTGRTLFGIVTAFAGYTAVYALNDVVDFRADRQKIAGCAAGEMDACGGDPDAALVRHPLAQGLLSFRDGLLWTLAWSLVALAGAWWLNPACVWIFGGGCLLEALYCLLWRVSPLRTFVSGAVKTAGALAGVLAVDPSPAPVFMVVLFLTFFCWEIGGQNIPNDWADLEADRKFGARTIPIHWGVETAARLVLACAVLSLAGMVLLFALSPLGFFGPAGLGALACGGLLVLLPALGLFRRRERIAAQRLFNRASYLPPALLLIVLLGIAWT
jgi:4-hydroxybenzoate polyprenyltransferase